MNLYMLSQAAFVYGKGDDVELGQIPLVIHNLKKFLWKIESITETELSFYL